MKKKIILICGATGFVGRNIAERLAEISDLEVRGTYFKSRPWRHPKIKMVRVDLTDKNRVNKTIPGVDIIIQAAATTSGAKEIIHKPYYHVTDNAVMNAYVLRAAHECKVSQLIFFSCSVMYQSSKMPVKETDFDANQTIFPAYFGAAWTKVYTEKACEFYSRIGSTKFTVIRHSNIYGPYDKFDLEKSHVFGATVTKVMTAKPNGEIIVWGNGKEERDLLYISDLVDFVELAIKKQKTPFELVNVGCGNSIPIREIISKIINYSQKNIRVGYDEGKPTLKTRLCLDISKARKIFGWSPKISLEAGIQKTIDWYRQSRNSMRLT